MNGDALASKTFERMFEKGQIALVWRMSDSSSYDAKQGLSVSVKDPNISTKTPDILNLPRAIKGFKQGRGLERQALREEVIRAIVSAQAASQQARDQSANQYMDMALSSLLADTSPSRLDDAIDVFSHLGSSVLQYGIDMLMRQSTPLDDDKCYVIVRSLGRAPNQEAVLTALDWCAKMPKRAIREAVVESLGEIPNPEATKRLREIKAHDSSKFIRELARDVINERSQ